MKKGIAGLLHRDLDLKLGLLGLGLLLGSLLASRGTYRIGLWMLALGLICQVFSRKPRLVLPPALGAFLGAGIYFLLIGALETPVLYYPDFFPVIWCLLVTTQVVQLGLRAPVTGETLELVIGLLLAAFVSLHTVFDLFWSHWPVWPKYGKSGLFSNVHYLAGYVLLTAPLLLYYALKAPLRLKLLIFLLLLAEAWLLFETRSRPAFLALLAAISVTLPWLGMAKARWILMVMVGLVGFLYVFDVGHFGYLSQELLGHLGADERVAIWKGTWHLQLESAPMAWLVGHGFGQFFHDFQLLTLTLKIKPWLSPHNFILEVLYSHGIMGLLVFVTLTGLFFAAIYRTILRTSGKLQALSVVLLATATGHFLFAFLTLPFWSRDYLLPMALVVGAGILLFFQSKKTADRARERG